MKNVSINKGDKENSKKLFPQKKLLCTSGWNFQGVPKPIKDEMKWKLPTKCLGMLKCGQLALQCKMRTIDGLM